MPMADSPRSDLWIAGNEALTTLESNDQIETFDPSSTYSWQWPSLPSLVSRLVGSSTFRDLETPFQVQYGSGAARGALGQDVVQMAGFTVNNQTFGTRTFPGSCHPSWKRCDRF